MKELEAVPRYPLWLSIVCVGKLIIIMASFLFGSPIGSTGRHSAFLRQRSSESVPAQLASSEFSSLIDFRFANREKVIHCKHNQLSSSALFCRLVSTIEFHQSFLGITFWIQRNFQWNPSSNVDLKHCRFFFQKVRTFRQRGSEKYFNRYRSVRHFKIQIILWKLLYGGKVKNQEENDSQTAKKVNHAHDEWKLKLPKTSIEHFAIIGSQWFPEI